MDYSCCCIINQEKIIILSYSSVFLSLIFSTTTWERFGKNSLIQQFSLKLSGNAWKTRNWRLRCSISFETHYKQDFHILARERKTFINISIPNLSVFKHLYLARTNHLAGFWLNESQNVVLVNWKIKVLLGSLWDKPWFLFLTPVGTPW